MKTITESVQCELDIRNSRFRAEAFPVTDQAEARSLLKSQKDKYADATHVVHAFVIGPTGGILGCSDDGEPSGTAGRPILDVLKGSGITNIMVTVTRWFGGTLLGTGGLVHAYGDSVKAVLERASVIELVDTRDFSFEVSYELYEKLKREMLARDISIIEESFGTAVFVRGTIRADELAAFSERVLDLSAGRTSLILSE